MLWRSEGGMRGEGVVLCVVWEWGWCAVWGVRVVCCVGSGGGVLCGELVCCVGSGGGVLCGE